MKQQAEQRQQEEEAFYRQQELMLDAEDQRRHLIAEEESKLADQRTRYGNNQTVQYYDTKTSVSRMGFFIAMLQTIN